MVVLKINGQKIRFLVDSGATVSCIRQKFPLTTKTMSITGCVGSPETKTFTEPLAVTLTNQTVEHEFLFLPECGVSICGRDLMCKLSLSLIFCPEGHKILNKSETILMMRRMKEKHMAKVLYLSPDVVQDLKAQTTIYWTEVITDSEKGNDASRLWQEYKTWAKSLYPMKEPFDPLHVTLNYVTLEDVTYDGLWEEVEGQTFQVAYTNLYLGPQGMALAVALPEELKPYYEGGKESTPHVSLAISKHHTQKQLGPMVKFASTLQYDATDTDKIFYNPQHQIFKIIVPQGAGDVTRASRQFRHRTFEDHPDTDRYLAQVPANVWMTNPNDVGQTNHVVKVELTTTKPIYRPQYPLKEDQIRGIQETVNGLLNSGVIYETKSDYNTPLFPVKKSDLVNWRMIQDLRPINEVTAGESYPVPDPYLALNNLSPKCNFYTVIDLANAYFTINLDPSSQRYFAFSLGGRQYTYRRMCQGWKLSAGYFNHFLRQDLENLQLPNNCTLIQYVDDIMLAGVTAQEVLEATVAVLTRLSENGYKIKRQKMQVARRSVYFLGREVSNGAQGVTDSNKDAILQAPKPTTVRQMLSFLGLCNYSREYVPGYTELTTPLRDLIKPHGMHHPTAELSWNQEAEEAFTKTKQAICSACALCAPDYTIPFHLDVMEKGSFVQAILYQKHHGTRKVLKHYSYKLDSHEQAQPGCARYLAALTKTIEKTSHLVQNHQLIVHTNHGILAYLNSRLFITTAQRSNNISSTLRQSHITYESGTINMATSMETEGIPHTCEEKVKTEIYVRADLQTTPLPDPEMTLFCDGCSYRAKEGHVISSYAVVKQLSAHQHEILEAEPIQGGSAQMAELMAVLRALQLSEGREVNIYTDSVYAYKTVTISIAGWIRNGFKLTTGLPIKHEALVRQLIDAVQLPKKLAIMKCKAHTKGQDSVSLGNHAADQATKKAANYDSRHMLVRDAEQSEKASEACMVDTKYVKEIQEAAGAYEQNAWKLKGAVKDVEGIWRNHEGRIVAPIPLLQMLFDEYHLPTHRSYKAILKHIDLWWHPQMQSVIQYWIDDCHICQTTTPKKACKPPPGIFTLPNKPFEKIVMDFTDMGPEMRVRGYRYLLVIVCEYTKWVEAFPCKTETAKEVVHHLTTEVFPRFGIPHTIRSDNGTHFTAKVVKDVLKALNISQRLGNLYHASSQGIVERMNATIKRKLAKVWLTSKLDWVAALPFVLMDIRNSVNATTSYSPHLLLTGREMHKPPGPFDEDTPFIEWDKQHHSYVKMLQTIVAQLHRCRQRTHDRKETLEPNMDISPGSWVYVKVHKRNNWTQPYQTGPYLVLQSTGRSVQVQKDTSKLWYHLSHCFKSPVDPTQRSLAQIKKDIAIASSDNMEDKEGDRSPSINDDGHHQSSDSTPEASEVERGEKEVERGEKEEERGEKEGKKRNT
uniref:ribonuclease H n=1 Tax=Neogobius melanostomus TaxID=47308 RepID=A0A8C6UYN4_9GOBI